MKQFLIPIIGAISLFSCSKYQYVTLSSDNTVSKAKNEFVAQNDSLKIEYRFSGDMGVPVVTVSNHSASMISIEWEKSFFITGENPELLHNPQNEITGEITRVNGREVINASISNNPKTEFIPPGSTISKTFFPVIRTGYVNKGNYQARHEKVAFYGIRKKTAKIKFNDSRNSPQSFRIYLSLKKEGTGGASEVLSIDNSFYMSEIILTKVEPETFANGKQDNLIFLRKPTTTGSIVSGAGVIGITAAALVIASKSKPL